MSSFLPFDLPNPLSSSLQIFVSEEVNSGMPDHRTLLRQEVFHFLENRYGKSDELNPVLDLSTIPSHPECSISISHCPTHSGFAISQNKGSLGFDLEDPSRLNSDLINRIASTAEQQLCPDPKLLFSAKEATWKALSEPFNIPTISHIETKSWSVENRNWHLFFGQFRDEKLPGRGFTCLKNGFCLSFFISP